MPRFRVCKAFTVESGHMLSKHAESCRYPHGHTRRVEVVVSSASLDANEMVVDFKALKLAVGALVDQFDHTLAMNSADPLLAAVQAVHPEGVVVFDNQDPTTEVLAKYLYDRIGMILIEGWSNDHYVIPSLAVRLERVRVWETPTSWAEYGD